MIVADAGPLIVFGRIGELDLLPKTLGQVIVPDDVETECLRDPDRPGALAIRGALESGLLAKASDPLPPLPPFPVLDAGESAAIRLALKLSAPVLIDEKAGRRIATNLGLTVIGSIGVLLAAKKRGHIEAVKPLLDAFEAHAYHVSAALVRAALIRAGER